MTQQSQSDGAPRGLNFPMGGGASGLGMGGMEGPDGSGQMSRPGPLGRHMKLFSSLGLSPSDLDALAEIPDEDISMETLPRILMQLKSRKAGGGERGLASSASGASFRGGRDGWDPSLGPARGFGYGAGPSPDAMFMQRRMGAPSSGKIQDFLGVTPPMFPHVCSLCDFDVHSSMVSTSSLLLLLLC